MKYMVYLIAGLVCLMFLGCNDKGAVSPESGSFIKDEDDSGDFKFITVYDYIRSQPMGGGVFIARIVPGESFAGGVKLSLKADPGLNAELDMDFLNLDNCVAEITIRPDSLIEVGEYILRLTAQNRDVVNSLEFMVEIFPAEPQDPRWAVRKKDEFMPWLKKTHPEYVEVINQKWFKYQTYPQIWIVEHWTFLSEEWEMRICFHVMIPPHDWSMMRLRKRGEAEPELAARRESDGTIYEIPASEYPLMFGY